MLQKRSDRQRNHHQAPYHFNPPGPGERVCRPLLNADVLETWWQPRGRELYPHVHVVGLHDAAR